MTYQFFNPAPVLFTLDALAPAAGGSIQFYDLNTTTNKLTWSNFERTVPNLNPVPLDSAGRPVTAIFLDGDYSVTIRDSAGVTVKTFDLRDPTAGGTAIPSLVSGRFLTNNGTSLSWGVIRQVPDPTGNANRILGTDGQNLLWEPKPTAPVLPITVRTNGISIGDGTRTFRILNGTGSAPASGGRTATVNITFPITFTTIPTIQLTPNTPILTGVGYSAVCTASSISTTGFTFTVDVNADQSGANITNAVAFSYTAMGESTQ